MPAARRERLPGGARRPASAAWFVVSPRRAFFESLTPEQQLALETVRPRPLGASWRPLRSIAAIRRGCRGGGALSPDGELVAVAIVGQRRGRRAAFVCRSTRELPERRAGATSPRGCVPSGGRDSATGSSRTAASTACRRCRVRRRSWSSAWSPRAPPAWRSAPIRYRAAAASPSSSAVPGLGSARGLGEADADTWLVDRAGRIDRAARSSPSAECTSRTPVAWRRSHRDVPRALVNSRHWPTRRFSRWRRWPEPRGRHFGRPQDIEWAIADRLVLLQSRPITSMRAIADPDGAAHHLGQQQHRRKLQRRHDAADVLVRARAYEHVYRQFCRMMGVPERVIAPQDDDFPQHARPDPRPRVLQPPELVSHARAAARLSGEPRFMEQMMGVKEPLPDDLAARIAERRSAVAALLDAFPPASHASPALIANHLTIDRQDRRRSTRGSTTRWRRPSPPLEDRRPTSSSRITATCERSCSSAGMRRSSTISSR